MVSIRKVKQSFQVRNPRQSQWDKEKVGLLAGGLCIGVLFVVLFQSMGSAGEDLQVAGPNDGAAGGNNNINNNNNPFRNRKAHPQLIQEDEDAAMDAGDAKEAAAARKKRTKMNDRFNAIALDILQTLDCEKLFEQTMAEIKEDSTAARGSFDEERYEEELENLGGEEEPDDEAGGQHFRRRRRRLQEFQHADDGAFDTVGDADAGDGDDNTGGNDDGEEDDGAEEKWGREALGGDTADQFEAVDDYRGAQGWNDDQPWANGIRSVKITGEHLFCLAATQEPPKEIVDEIACKASGSKRQTLLDLWSAARAQILDVKLMRFVLSGARESKYQLILDKSYNLWAPENDSGMTYMVNTLNNDLTETINSLAPSLGPDKLFVDVGSGLGLTTLAVTQKYPGTIAVSMEPASPNWLLQEVNLRCNLDKPQFHNIKVVLAGVGPNTDDEDNMMAKLMWRPTSTTSTRAWTPAAEQSPQDVELFVRLKKLRSILAEVDIVLDEKKNIDVLNLDCQGCEYNLIPALSERDFDAIRNVMGNVHWGYIPLQKLPSSERGRQTHQRVCQHENIAKVTKECCSCLDVPVKANAPGEILYTDNGKNPPKESTVADIIDEGLCKNFDAWAKEHYLNGIEDDWGWFELSSLAQ